jgi:hypothetical protein
MRKPIRLAFAAAMLAAAAACPHLLPAQSGVAAPPTTRPIASQDVDLAICLDTSGSMDGLIDSARQKLWAIVNELAKAQPKPNLRVALYHYGNDGLDAKTGWVSQLSDLTADLDGIYSKLFALKTNGGTEYVARVSVAAAEQLTWSVQKGALKIIVVAGNEAATQDDKIKLKDACQLVAGKGIIINTIYCGDEASGRQTGWADAAAWADGQFAAIDANNGTVAVNTPFDKDLADLSGKLNTTYVGYGAKREAAAQQQAAMDSAAKSTAPAAAAERAVTKSGALYRNSGWDLNDALADGTVKLADVKAEDLPEAMHGLDAAGREKYLQEKAKERADIQKQIQELGVKREAYVKAEMTKQGLSDKQSLDANLRNMIRQQATKNGFVFEETKTPTK